MAETMVGEHAGKSRSNSSKMTPNSESGGNSSRDGSTPPMQLGNCLTVIRGVTPGDPRLSQPTKIDSTEWDKRKRNTFACVRCHSTKQKCVPSDLDNIYLKPCARCLKRNKICEFDLSKRTRRKRHCNPSGNGILSLRKTSKISNSNSSSKLDSGYLISDNKPFVKKTEAQTTLPVVNPPSVTLPNIHQSFSGRWPGPIQAEPSILNTSGALKQNSIGSLGGPQITVPMSMFNNNISSHYQAESSVPKAIQNTLPQPYAYFSYNVAPTGPTVPNASYPSNSNDDNNGNIRQHNHSERLDFRKQLHSLLIHQKGKVGKLFEKFESLSKLWNETVQKSNYPPVITDPISVGIINEAEAQLRLHLYKTEISYNCKIPFIRISSSTTVDELRHQKPILFAAIMSTVSVIMTPENTTVETNMKLESFILHLITVQIFRTNIKSVELLESLLTLCLWYNIPEWSSRTHYHIFNYIGCCLTRDLGPTVANRSFGMFFEEDPCRRKHEIKTPLELYENGPRLTLLNYISALNISIFLRQANQSRWSSFTEKACESIIKNSNMHDELYDGEDDRMLVVFGRLNYILEKIHLNLHEMDEPREVQDDPEFAEKHIQNLVTTYELQLRDIFQEIPRSRFRVLSFFFSVKAYLYQYIIGRAIRDLPSRAEIYPISDHITQAFINCYQCCIMSLEEFLKLPPKLVSSLPLFHTSRTIYTVGLLLLKVRYSAVSVESLRHLKSLTDPAVKVVNRVSMLLEESSKMYAFNNFLYKIQYVVALFVQTYANKVMLLSDPVDEEPLHKTSHILLKKEQGPQWNVSTNDGGDENRRLPTKNANATYENNLPVPVSTVKNIYRPDPRPRESVFQPAGLMEKKLNDFNQINEPTSQNPEVEPIRSMQSDVDPSPSTFTTNLNEYLADVDSLVLGFNALNDEFWTDIFNI